VRTLRSAWTAEHVNSSREQELRRGGRKLHLTAAVAILIPQRETDGHVAMATPLTASPISPFLGDLARVGGGELDRKCASELGGVLMGSGRVTWTDSRLYLIPVWVLSQRQEWTLHVSPQSVPHINVQIPALTVWLDVLSKQENIYSLLQQLSVKISSA
jgi:hypothetical protein